MMGESLLTNKNCSYQPFLSFEFEMISPQEEVTTALYINFVLRL